MSILDNYLSELFGRKKKQKKQQKMPEFVDLNDPSLPNPYNFRKLKLDPKITRSDILKANKEWEIIRKKGWAADESSFYKIIKNAAKNENANAYTIVDKNKRVGIIILDTAYFTYVTWVKGKNYATAAIMKFLNMPIIPQLIILNKKKEFMFMDTWIKAHKDNKASNMVAKNLKAKLEYSDSNTNEYSIVAPYWWNNHKILKNIKE